MVFVDSPPLVPLAGDNATPIHGRNVCGQEHQDDGNADANFIHCSLKRKGSGILVINDVVE